MSDYSLCRLIDRFEMALQEFVWFLVFVVLGGSVAAFSWLLMMGVASMVFGSLGFGL